MPTNNEHLKREAQRNDESRNDIFDSWIVDSTTDEEPNYEHTKEEGRED